MARLWVREIVKQRIKRQTTVECGWDGAIDALTEVCHELDIGRPLWLRKHETEFENFRHTSFLPEHFMEDVPFDKLEIEFIDDPDKKRRSADPRNHFD